MTQQSQQSQWTQHVSFRVADEVREFPYGRAEIVKVGESHDAWVIGDEPVVVVDWFGASDYALRP
jgi:hypothetical protein